MAEIPTTYNCTQLELYSIAELCYNNLERDLKEFVAKNTKYTEGYLAELRATRDVAIALPDEVTREAQHQTLGNLLKTKYLSSLLDDFADLKTYIKNGWPGEDNKPRYDSAGQTKFTKASDYNWDVAAGLAKSMVDFITVNSTILKSPGGMPDSFATNAESHKTAFDSNYAEFKKSRETGIASAAKVKANNLLDVQMKDVLEDGATSVYRNNLEKQHEYRFTTLKAIISPPGSASLKVFVERADDTMVVNQLVTIKTAGIPAVTATTNDKGVAIFDKIDPGIYSGTVVINSLTTKFTKDVNKGVDARITVVID